MPFRSRSQMRWMYAEHPRMAKEWSHHTPNIRGLPEHAKKKGKHKKGMDAVFEKLAFEPILTGALLGGVGGGAMAPKGHVAEGVGRGDLLGAGAGVGTYGGALAGAGAGQLSELVVRALTRRLSRGRMGAGPTEGVGAMTGAALGAVPGAIAGYKGTQRALGPPTWEAKQGSDTMSNINALAAAAAAAPYLNKLAADANLATADIYYLASVCGLAPVEFCKQAYEDPQAFNDLVGLVKEAAMTPEQQAAWHERFHGPKRKPVTSPKPGPGLAAQVAQAATAPDPDLPKPSPSSAPPPPAASPSPPRPRARTGLIAVGHGGGLTGAEGELAKSLPFEMSSGRPMPGTEAEVARAQAHAAVPNRTPGQAGRSRNLLSDVLSPRGVRGVEGAVGGAARGLDTAAEGLGSRLPGFLRSRLSPRALKNVGRGGLAGLGALGVGGLGLGANALMGGSSPAPAPTPEPPAPAPEPSPVPAPSPLAQGAQGGGGGMSPHLKGLLAAGGLTAGGIGLHHLMSRRNRKKEVAASDNLVVRTMRRALLVKMAALQARESRHILSDYLDELSRRISLEKQASVRALQSGLCQGRPLSTSIKLAYPTLSGEQRGILATRLTAAAARWARKQANMLAPAPTMPPSNKPSLTQPMTAQGPASNMASMMGSVGAGM